MFENAFLKNTHLLLFIYNRNRLRRINFLSTERQQRLKTKTLCTMLVIITKKSHYPFLEFSRSAALYVSSSLARPLLSLPNSILFSRELLSLSLSLSLFLTLQHYLFFSLRDSHVGRCRQSRGALRGRCATILHNLVAHRLLIGRRPLRDSHVGVARPLRDCTP